MRYLWALAAGLALAGCSSSGHLTSGKPSHPTPTHSGSSTPAVSPAVSPGERAAAGFRATDATFVSPSEGWVIGPRGLLRTTDGGGTWTALPEPPRGTRNVRFANDTVGYVWRPQHPLWITTDGGTNWRLGGLRRVYSIEIASSGVWALSGPLPYPKVQHAAVGSANWSEFGTSPDRGATLDAHGSLAYVTGQQGAGPVPPSLDVWSADGSRRHEHLPCVTHDVIPWSPLGVSTDDSLVLDCDVEAPHNTHQQFYTSNDQGRSWARVAAPAHLPDEVTAIPAARFAFGHGISADDGGGWQIVLPPTAAEHFTVAGFEDDVHGIALTHGGVLYRTTDSGRTWRSVRL